jgi:hypothetical protein
MVAAINKWGFPQALLIQTLWLARHQHPSSGKGPETLVLWLVSHMDPDVMWEATVAGATVSSLWCSSPVLIAVCGQTRRELSRCSGSKNGSILLCCFGITACPGVGLWPVLGKVIVGLHLVLHTWGLATARPTELLKVPTVHLCGWESKWYCSFLPSLTLCTCTRVVGERDVGTMWVPVFILSTGMSLHLASSRG